MLRDWARMRCGRSVVERNPAMLIEFTVGDRLLLPFCNYPQSPSVRVMRHQKRRHEILP